MDESKINISPKVDRLNVKLKDIADTIGFSENYLQGIIDSLRNGLMCANDATYDVKYDCKNLRGG